MPFRIGPTELIIILVIVLLIFGAGRLSQAGGALGRGIRDFRTALRGGEVRRMGKKGRDGTAV